MSVSVKDFGAKGDGTTDDRAAFEAALAVGDLDVFVPNGRYLLSQRPGKDYCIQLTKDGTRFHGENQDGTVLVQAPGLPGSVRTIRCSAPGLFVDTMTGDGNKSAQTADEHRCFVFAQNAQNLVLQSLTATNHTGDGLYVYDRSTVTANSVRCMDNDRNGMTMGGGTTGGQVTNSVFTGNRAEQFDTEGGQVSNMVLRRNTFVGAQNDYALTIAGYSPDLLSDGWIVEGNQIYGAISVVWASDVVLRGNTCINSGSLPSLTLYRTTKDCTIEDNEFQCMGLSNSGSAPLMVTGTGTGSGSSRARFYNNHFQYAGQNPAVFGARIEGAVSVEIVDNTFQGNGMKAPGYAGIYLRATNPAEDWMRASVIGNVVTDWGDLGLKVDGNGAALMRYLEIFGNSWANTLPGNSMVSALQLNEPNNRTSCARDVVHFGSILGAGCTQLIRIPPGGSYKAAGDRWTSPGPP
jgi:hypothetical protein